MIIILLIFLLDVPRSYLYVIPSQNNKNINCFAKSDSLVTLPTLRKIPLVTLIGSTNVGKSSLFNRMTKKFQMGSLVSENPNTTRDPNVGVAEINGKEFVLIDTPGICESDYCDKIIRDQIDEAIVKSLEESTMSIMVVDGQLGLTNLDRKISEMIREHCKNRDFKCIIAVNKCESHLVGLSISQQFWNLGLGEPIPCSALHGSGVAEVLEKCLEHLPDLESQAEIPKHITVGLFGRPNTGKSSIANRLINNNRFIVSPIAGTTVDSVDAYVSKDDKIYRIVDTCGITQNLKNRELELKKERTLLSIRQADVCMLVVDSTTGISKTELDFAQSIREESKPAIIVCNKWDLIDKTDPSIYNKVLNFVKETLHDLSYANAIFISANSGQRVTHLFDLIDECIENYNREYPQKTINELIQDAMFINPPKYVKGKKFNIYYSAQIHTRPPGFVLFCNNNKSLTKEYEKYLADTLVKSFKITGTPIRIYKREKRLRNVVKDVRPPNSYIFRPKNFEFGPSPA